MIGKYHAILQEKDLKVNLHRKFEHKAIKQILSGEMS